MLEGVAALKLKDNSYFLISVHTQSSQITMFMNSICSPLKLDEKLSRTTFCVPYNICVL